MWIVPTLDPARQDRDPAPPPAVVIDEDIHTKVAVCPICPECAAIVPDAELVRIRLEPDDTMTVTRVRYTCGWCGYSWLVQEEDADG